MTFGQQYLETVRAIPESFSKEERIRITLEAQQTFNHQIEEFRANERSRLAKLRE
jgi:hypothetical protein